MGFCIIITGIQMQKETIAYVYMWRHTPSLRWYIGSRTSKGCHPDDGYICSSKVVKPLVKAKPEEWVRVILETGEAREMFELEVELLNIFDAKNDPRSFNMHNGDGKFSLTGKQLSEATRLKMSLAKTGIPMSQEARNNMSKARKGVPIGPRCPEHSAKISVALKGRKRPPRSPKHSAKIGAANIKKIIATNITTGETFEINGHKEMKMLGFTSSAVSLCARGKQRTHRGHMFKFEQDILSSDIKKE